jgi:hypothetical protein
VREDGAENYYPAKNDQRSIQNRLSSLRWRRFPAQISELILTK